MFPLSTHDFVMTMAASLFIMGVISVGAGVFILIAKVMSGDLRAITQQTARLAQKGLAEDVAGLVGNASSLIDALNQLLRTSSGIGMFLIMVGFILFSATYYLLVRFP